MTRRIWNGAYRVVANSDGLRKLALTSAPAQVIDVIPNGVDLPRTLRPAREPHEGMRILTVSRLIERKGIDTLIEAIAALRIEAVSLDIAGEGPWRARLEKLARDRGIGNRVHFHGFVKHDRLARLYSQADVFVLPSRAESCSMALLEAMGMGLPIIATRVGGTPELIENGENGLLTQTDDPGELAAAILKLFENPKRREAFSTASLQRVRERFSWLRAAKRYEAIFRDAVDLSARKQCA